MVILSRRGFLTTTGAAAVLPGLYAAPSAGFRFAVIADSHIVDSLYTGPEGNPEDTESMLHTADRLRAARDFLNELKPAPELVFLVGDYFHNYPFAGRRLLFPE